MIVAPYVFIRNYNHSLLLQYFFIFTKVSQVNKYQLACL